MLYDPHDEKADRYERAHEYRSFSLTQDTGSDATRRNRPQQYCGSLVNEDY